MAVRTRIRLLARLLGIALCGYTALCGCGGPGPVVVPLPGPAPPEASRCADLYAQLPATVSSYDRREVKPRSSFTAAWGDPAVVLRCGVPAPAGLRGSETAPVGINGVAWLAGTGADTSTSTPAATVNYTVVDRGVFVRVDIPRKYEGQSSILIDVSNAVAAALPERPIPQ